MPMYMQSLANAELEVEASFKYQTISSSGSLSSFFYANHTGRPDLLSQGLHEFGICSVSHLSIR